MNDQIDINNEINIQIKIKMNLYIWIKQVNKQIINKLMDR